MLNRLWAAALACLLASAARADPPPTAAPDYRSGVALQPASIYDANGNIVSSFGAEPPSVAFFVAKTAGIGTTAVQVSGVEALRRRVIRNTGSTACEFMPAATAYGTGHPLPAGESFVFDASGRTTAAIFVACAAAGGSVSVVSY